MKIVLLKKWDYKTYLRMFFKWFLKCKYFKTKSGLETFKIYCDESIFKLKY